VDIHRLLVATVRDYGIFVLDPGGHVTTWNAGAERIKGYSADEILGRHFSTFYTPEDLAAGKPAMELRVASATGRYEDEGWRVRKDGTLFWANVVITALLDPAGELIGFAKVTRDLTERRSAELQRVADARRVAEAEASNRAKSDFLTALSHELRTPLNAIGGYIDLIALGIHGPVTDAQRDALERVRASQQHLLMLITDLLNFSRIEAGRIRYDVAPVSLTDVVASVRPMIEPQAAARQITFEWQVPDEPVVALGDRGKIGQILLNLVTNAVKYTESGGRVTVRQLRHGDRAALEVSDTGIGIAEDQLEAIFEPFTQVGRSLTSPHEGAGLGLAISRELARAMGGDLVAQSDVGTGSRFTLTLPIPAAEGS
jgi:PAS domain S-box-containing protein